MYLEKRESGGIPILDLHGKILGGEESEALRSEFDKVIDKEKPFLLLNLKGVPWMNSSGLGILLSGYLRLKENGGAVKFIHVQERVMEILVTTKLVHVLEVFDDEEKALASFESGESWPAEHTS